MVRLAKKLLLMIFLVTIFLIKTYSADGILSFRLVHPDNDKLSSLVQSQVKIDKERYEYLKKENESYWVDRKVEMDIHDLKSAKIKIMTRKAESSQWEYVEVTPETFTNLNFPSSSKPCLVDICFNQQGRKKLANVTDENTGRRLAVVFQGELVMAPLITEKIDAEYMSMVGLSIDEAKLLKDAITGSNK